MAEGSLVALLGQLTAFDPHQPLLVIEFSELQSSTPCASPMEVKCVGVTEFEAPFEWRGNGPRVSPCAPEHGPLVTLTDELGGVRVVCAAVEVRFLERR